MLNASIVLYNPNWEQVVSLTNVILQAEGVDCVYWIDNSPNPIDELPLSSNKLKYIFNNKKRPEFQVAFSYSNFL